MLILARQLTESVVITPNPDDLEHTVKIQILELRNDRVRLGIVAPKSILVDRHEIYQKRLNDYKNKGRRNTSPPPKPTTPWFIHCQTHGTQSLTKEEYTRQLQDADALWTCPVCNQVATWMDED